MLIAIAIVIVLGLSGLRVAQEYQRGVVFRLGRYVGLRGPGLYWIIPLNIERAVTIDVRTRTVSAEQQETITPDSRCREVRHRSNGRTRRRLPVSVDRAAQHHRTARP